MSGRSVEMALVAAVARNGVIGADGALPWRIGDDLKWFKEKTMGKPMIMGRKTFASIGKALPGRDTIVATRDLGFAAPGAFVVHSLPAARKLALACAAERGASEICIVGGGDIYAQTMLWADRIYLTRVDAESAGDVMFPAIDPARWRETACGGAPKNERNDAACEFFILERRRG